MPRAYLKKISAIQTKRTQGRFAQTVYQAAVLTVTGTVETISFSGRAGHDAFVLWLRRTRRSESAGKRPM
ncbi:MAG: hypothetical protein LUC50_02690 [Ruminococcus sp.]|nr:hypothetical protein [Ruminococcus sp.]